MLKRQSVFTTAVIAALIGSRWAFGQDISDADIRSTIAARASSRTEQLEAPPGDDFVPAARRKPTAGKTILKSRSGKVIRSQTPVEASNAVDSENAPVGTKQRTPSSAKESFEPMVQSSSAQAGGARSRLKTSPSTVFNETEPTLPRTRKANPRLQLTQYEIDEQGETVPTSVAFDGQDGGVTTESVPAPEGAPAPEGIPVPAIDTKMSLEEQIADLKARLDKLDSRNDLIRPDNAAAIPAAPSAQAIPSTVQGSVFADPKGASGSYGNDGLTFNTVELGGNRYPVVSYVKLTTHTSYHRSRDHGWFALFRYA
jgi:hypothetical protein